MALTFNTAGLLKIIDGITTARDAEEQRYSAACLDARAQYVVDWNNARVEQIRALRDYLTRSLKAGTPPHHAEAMRIAPALVTSCDYIQFFVPGGDAGITKKQLGYQRSDELDGLAAILRAHQGETVTAHQLKELGAHPRDLAAVVLSLVAGVAVSP